MRNKKELKSSTCYFLFDPIISLLFQFQREFLRSRFDNSPIVNDVNIIRDDVIQQPLVVGYHDSSIIGGFKLVHPIGHNSQSIDIQSGIGFIEYRKGGLEHRQLENFVSFLFPA